MPCMRLFWFFVLGLEFCREIPERDKFWDAICSPICFSCKDSYHSSASIFCCWSVEATNDAICCSVSRGATAFSISSVDNFGP